MPNVSRVPHFATIVGFSIAAVIGYAAFSVWAVFYSDDATLQGDVIGTWKSFAVAGFTFWIGSSVGGKTQPTNQPPTSVEVVNSPSQPVPVDVPEPTFGKKE